MGRIAMVWRMGVRDRLLAGLARQLGRPSGLRGRLVGTLLNRANRRTVGQAIEALSLPANAVVADIGFGGAVGLGLLTEEVGAGGQVHGVELSQTMLSSAARRFRCEIQAGRLHLHDASMTQMPLADDSLDGVLTVNTIYFVAELDRALSELARVVKRSGRVVIGIGDPEAMEKMPFSAHGFTIRPVAEVVEALASAGLTVQDDRRVGDGADAAHLLIAAPTGPTG